MPDLSSVIAMALADSDGEPLLDDVFGTAEPGQIAALVDDFCRTRLGAGVARYEFFATSVGSVHGVRLDDGRRVVVKAHRRDADAEHLAAVQQVQARLADAGFATPHPVLAPTPLARGMAVVETLLDRGASPDAHDPAGRRAVAAGLARLIALSRPLAGLPGLRSWREASERLWRQPHDPRFDFAGTARSAEWIDRLATEARRHLDEHVADDQVVGHSDWRVEHLRFTGGAVSAVYDWDSLAVGPEPVFAGSAAHAFTADWSTAGSLAFPRSRSRWPSSTPTRPRAASPSTATSGALPTARWSPRWPTPHAASTPTGSQGTAPARRCRPQRQFRQMGTSASWPATASCCSQAERAPFHRGGPDPNPPRRERTEDVLQRDRSAHPHDRAGRSELSPPRD